MDACDLVGFILRRLLHLVPVLIAASACIFFMSYAVPGGPVAVLVGENATPGQIRSRHRALRPRSACRRAICRLALARAAWRSRRSLPSAACRCGSSSASGSPQRLNWRRPRPSSVSCWAYRWALASALSARHLARPRSQLLERAGARRSDILGRHTPDPALRGRAPICCLPSSAYVPIWELPWAHAAGDHLPACADPGASMSRGSSRGSCAAR